MVITMKKFLILIAVAILGVSFYVVTKPADATFSITICHHNPGNAVTHTFNNLQSYLGHLGTPHNGSTYDTQGACPTSSPTPSASPTASPSSSPSATPSATPSASPSPSQEPTASSVPECEEQCEPTSTPEATSTPVETTRPETPLTQAGAPELPFCVAPLWAPTVTYDGQKGDTFSYHWTTVKEGLHTYLVKYGFTKDFLPYNVIVHEEKVSITMYGGHTNWIQVFGYEEPGCVGPGSIVLN